MTRANEDRICELERRLAEFEDEERRSAAKLAELARQLERALLQEERAHREVVQELGHLGRQISQTRNWGEEQLRQLYQDRDAMDLVMAQVEGIGSDVSAVQGSVEFVGGNLGAALSALGVIQDNVGLIGSSMAAAQVDLGAISSGVADVTGRVGLMEASLAEANDSLADVGAEVEGVISRVGTAESKLTSVEGVANSAKAIAEDAKEAALAAQNSATQATTAAQEVFEQTSQLSNTVTSLAGTTSDYDERLALLEEQFTASFHPATPVDTASGSIPIGDLKPGARVWRPLGYGRFTLMAQETVIETTRRISLADNLFRVTLCDGTSFMATGAHAVAALAGSGLRLVRVRDFAVGTAILAYRRISRLGLRQMLSVVKIEPVESAIEVCNLVLPHRQFLVAGGLLAH